MRPRQGLTLLEVLASLVLLSALAAACIPLLQSATRVLSESTQSDSQLLFELSALADKALENPDQFEEIQDSSDSLSLPWPEQPERSTVVLVARLSDSAVGDNQSHAPTIKGAWLRFSCDGAGIYRWIAIDEETKANVAKEPRR